VFFSFFTDSHFVLFLKLEFPPAFASYW